MSALVEELEKKLKFTLDYLLGCGQIDEARYQELLEDYTRCLRSADPYSIEFMSKDINKFHRMTQKEKLRKDMKIKIAITVYPPANDAE